MARRFVRKAFLFTGVAVGLALVLQWALVLGLTRYNTSARGVWNAVIQGKVNADIIVCGSSRALVHYDPRVIASKTGWSTYDLGRNGTWPDLQQMFLKVYLAHNKAPKCIVINVDHTCFTVTKQVYDPAQYIPYLNEACLYERLVSLDPRFERMRRIPLLGIVEHRLFLTSVAGLVGMCGKEDHFNGFAPSNRAWTGEFDKFKANNLNGFTIPIEEKGVMVFSKLVECSLNSRATVVLVYSPEYLEAQALTNNRRDILERVREIATHYGVEFWDFSDDTMCRDRSLFYNSQHMNWRGADLFSSKLAERLKCFCASKGLSAAPIAVTKTVRTDVHP